MSIRTLLQKLRLRPVQLGEGERSIDNVDAMTTMEPSPLDVMGNMPVSAPPNWVPSQQDERPE